MLKDSEEKTQAILGGSCFLVGLLFIIIQRWIFASRTISFISVNPLTREAYAEKIFTPPAGLIFCMSLVCALIWYFKTVKWSEHFKPQQTGSAILQWSLFGIGPLLAFLAGLLIWGRHSSAALPWLAVFFFLDIVILYWLSSILSVPHNMVHTVPLASLFRKD